MAVSETVPQKVQKPIRDGVYVICQNHEGTGDSRFIAEVGQDVWITKWFAGRLSLQAAAKAWQTQQHLFKRLDEKSRLEYWRQKARVSE